MREEIINWIMGKFEQMGIDITDFNYDEDIYTQGVSSLEFIQLVVFIETEFDIEFEDEYLSNNRMNTVSVIVNYIMSHR